MIATASATPAPVVQYRPVGAVRDAVAARDAEVLVAGPAGTGKTLGVCWKLHLAAIRYPKARILMVRKTLESLKTGALHTLQNGVQPERWGVQTFGGNKFSPAEFRYPNGSVIIVSGMDKAEKVLSAEYDLIFVNEATELSETDWETLTSRLRNGRMPYQQIIADCNPSGPRHWLNVRCHRGQTRRITSTHRDNPAYWDTAAGDWTPLGRQYVETTLAGLTGVQRKRLYEGVWAAAEGLVYPEFDPDRHVRYTYTRHTVEDDTLGEIVAFCDPKTHTDVTGWRTVLGVDVGSRNPTAILTMHLAADERMHISHEVYRRNMTATAILDAIAERVDATGAEAVYIDPSAKGYIDDLHARGYPATAAVNDVLVGIQRVHAAFAAGVTIDPSCVNTIDELGMYAYPENPKIETDKPTKEHDHALDAWRYVCATESPLLEGELFW